MTSDSTTGAGAVEAGREPVTILYTNWRGETAVRRIVPREHLPVWFGRNDWHPEPQWILSARDVDKGEDRTFALSGIKAWGKEAVEATLATARPDESLGTVLKPFVEAANSLLVENRADDSTLPEPGSAPVEGWPPIARPLDDYHEDMGDVLWWKFPIQEAPYVGSPLDLGRTIRFVVEGVDEGSRSVTYQVGGWPGYHTHFTFPPPPPADPSRDDAQEAGADA